MPPPPLVELVYFTGCPHVEAARAALRTALGSMGLPPVWQEWDQAQPTAPAYVQGFGSPTVLVAGRDVSGVGACSTGRACCATGAAQADAIRAALGAARGAAPGAPLDEGADAEDA
ncbi:MAG: hypothetical protein ACOY71_12560 [Gemmatimonadota bacterium]